MQDLSLIIRQAIGSAEGRAVSQAALMRDIAMRTCSLEQLQVVDLAAALREGAALPVGSVQFLREAMRVAGLTEPPNMSYPRRLVPLLGRKLYLGNAGGPARATSMRGSPKVEDR